MIVSIILAAGEGTRMKSKYSKVTQTLLNRPMISYVLDAAKAIEGSKNVMIVGKNKDVLPEFISDDKLVYIEQKIGPEFPYGTGYAVKLAENEWKDEDDVLILNGDIPLLTGETLKNFVDYHLSSNNTGSIMTAIIDEPSNYGRIVKKENGYIDKIVEHRDCNPDELAIHEINPGIYIFKGSYLSKALKELDTNNDQGELYITDVVSILSNKGEQIGTFPVSDVSEIYGINSKDQLADSEGILRMRVNTFYMKQGVIMEHPFNTFIEPGVKIGRDTRIGSGVKILGDTIIGEDCKIFGDTEIVDSKIGNNVLIRSSFIEKSEISDGVTMGPYAHLRPNSKLLDNVHIGNFVEVKNAVMGKGTKAGHLAYIGDADLGENINIGCGAIFVNYDGINKHRSVAEDGAFIGSNANIVAPVKICKDAFIAAGATVTEDVEEGVLFVSRQTAKKIAGWVKKKRETTKKIKK